MELLAVAAPPPCHGPAGLSGDFDAVDAHHVEATVAAGPGTPINGYRSQPPPQLAPTQLPPQSTAHSTAQHLPSQHLHAPPLQAPAPLLPEDALPTLDLLSEVERLRVALATERRARHRAEAEVAVLSARARDAERRAVEACTRLAETQQRVFELEHSLASRARVEAWLAQAHQAQAAAEGPLAPHRSYEAPHAGHEARHRVTHPGVLDPAHRDLSPYLQLHPQAQAQAQAQAQLYGHGHGPRHGGLQHYHSHHHIAAHAQPAAGAAQASGGAAPAAGGLQGQHLHPLPSTAASPWAQMAVQAAAAQQIAAAHGLGPGRPALQQQHSAPRPATQPPPAHQPMLAHHISHRHARPPQPPYRGSLGGNSNSASGGPAMLFYEERSSPASRLGLSAAAAAAASGSEAPATPSAGAVAASSGRATATPSVGAAGGRIDDPTEGDTSGTSGQFFAAGMGLDTAMGVGAGLGAAASVPVPVFEQGEECADTTSSDEGPIPDAEFTPAAEVVLRELDVLHRRRGGSYAGSAGEPEPELASAVEVQVEAEPEPDPEEAWTGSAEQSGPAVGPAGEQGLKAAAVATAVRTPFGDPFAAARAAAPLGADPVDATCLVWRRSDGGAAFRGGLAAAAASGGGSWGRSPAGGFLGALPGAAGVSPLQRACTTGTAGGFRRVSEAWEEHKQALQPPVPLSSTPPVPTPLRPPSYELAAAYEPAPPCPASALAAQQQATRVQLVGRSLPALLAERLRPSDSGGVSSNRSSLCTHSGFLLHGQARMPPVQETPAAWSDIPLGSPVKGG
ncbi:hypothetical protein HYH03_004832 [Edaphochlamys debaryana]|uniref:Uncharacterized protein n=1 Tax=Edaphochlamys debaryana TaxID=47281 RepID=A0A836C2Z4_9CHLO|nr:hypothetical protein HYH03_004832 [Edaphochlamys debaryana]|eukprot:KAG2497248.1 hypothetical protein HYH03_004832 [Edaphochlamys debaryana]